MMMKVETKIYRGECNFIIGFNPYNLDKFTCDLYFHDQ